MKKILVTGSQGLVGSALQSIQGDFNYDFIFTSRKDADLRDRAAVQKVFERIRPDAVIHLAARVGGVGANMKYPGQFFRENLDINLNVLEVARTSGVQRLVSMLSTCVYPDRVEYPLKAERLHDGPPHSSNFGYAYAKRMLEVQSRAYRAEYGVDFVCGVPTNIYGPHDNFDLEDAHVLPALIHRCFLAKQENKPLVVWGSGKPLREFVLARDVAELTVRTLEAYRGQAPLIYSSGLETSIADAVMLVAKAMDFRGEIRFDSTKPDGQLRKPSDPKPLKDFLPAFEFVSPFVGIPETVKWFLEHREEARMKKVC